MAGQASKEELVSILVQAMIAQKNLRPQHDRLLQARDQLNQQLKPSDDEMAAGLRQSAFDAEDIHPSVAATFHKLAAERMRCVATLNHCALASDLAGVYYVGVDAAKRPLAACLELAAETGAGLALSSDFAAVPEEELFDALVALRLPARPTTQEEAFARVEAAFYAVKLSEKHHLPSCIEHLIGDRPRPVTDEKDNPVDAATEYLAKTDTPAAATTGESPRAAANLRVDVDKTRDYLDRACTLVSLAVEHIDLAVAVISTFLDLQEVASLSEFADRAAYISEDYFLRATSFF